MTTLTDQEHAEVIKLLKAGKPYREISIRFNVSTSTVAKIKEKAPDIPKSRRTKVTLDVAKRAITLLCETELSFSVIGKRLGISRASVSSIANGHLFPELDRKNYQPRQGGFRTCKIDKETAKQIYQEYESGVPQQELADKHGVKRSYISRLCTGYVYPDVGNINNRYTKQKLREKNNSTVLTNRGYLKMKQEKLAKRKGMKYNRFGMLVPLDARMD